MVSIRNAAHISLLKNFVECYMIFDKKSIIIFTLIPLWWGGGLVAKSCPTLVPPWIVAHQAPLSMGFSRQEYQSGLPFPSPGDVSDPGIEPRSPTLQADSLASEPPGNLTSIRGQGNQGS